MLVASASWVSGVIPNTVLTGGSVSKTHKGPRATLLPCSSLFFTSIYLPNELKEIPLGEVMIGASSVVSWLELDRHDFRLRQSKYCKVNPFCSWHDVLVFSVEFTDDE